MSSSDSLISEIDPQMLSLFPSLAVKKPADLKKLACLRALGEAGRPLSHTEVSKIAGIPAATAKKNLGDLVMLSLLTAEKKEKQLVYTLTAKGAMALMSFAPFRSFSKVLPVLSLQKNDDLAFAMLVIGNSSAERKDDLLYTILSGYAKYGHSMESRDGQTAADSLLRYYASQCKVQSKTLPPYLNMFRDFTPAGFQDILKMLLVALKPTPDDYNWLVQFFHELVEFYYNPVRIAYMNMLTHDTVLKSRLDQYRKEQEAMMKKADGGIELTFKVLGGFELEKFVNMPPHLKAMGLKLVLEPLRFMNDELRAAFWSQRQYS